MLGIAARNPTISGVVASAFYQAEQKAVLMKHQSVAKECLTLPIATKGITAALLYQIEQKAVLLLPVTPINRVYFKGKPDIYNSTHLLGQHERSASWAVNIVAIANDSHGLKVKALQAYNTSLDSKSTLTAMLWGSYLTKPG